ncbi:tethering factor for nuclear proteasome sts1 [Calycina marina]|uniref:Tethering factor for nuclear proteasome STS1 n=1 Tax=Calycina marina TaxID=1763456 RepID=A0A9P7Z529_9HELO|nr:tethering factor for nuclear proteasome sts1 [Calycina marina]
MNVLQRPALPYLFSHHETPIASPSQQTMSTRKRKADDDGQDEHMHYSPTPLNRVIAARPSKKVRGNEIAGRPLALPRLLESLDADSLRNVLQQICERRPDIGAEVISSAPRPSAADAVDVLQQYQEKLKAEFPFGGNQGSDYAYNRVRQALVDLINALADYTPHFLPPNESQITVSLAFLDSATKFVHELPEWDSQSHKYHKDNAYDEISGAWALVVSEASKRGGGFGFHSGGWDQKLTKHNEQSGGRMQVAVQALGSGIDWMGGNPGGNANDPQSIRNELFLGTYGIPNQSVRVGKW